MPYQFIQARNFTPGRITPIDVVVMHTMESPEAPGTALAVAKWFAGASAPLASAHYCVDPTTVIQCVWDTDTAWHAPGANGNGIGVEMAGRASQTSAQWDDPDSRGILDNAARLVAQKCAELKIPVVWLTADDLRAGRSGITGHADVSKAFKQSDHTDPGVSFPVAEFLVMVNHYLMPDDYWTWLAWYLGEGDFKGHQRDMSVRPNVPLHIPDDWWARLDAFVAARQK